MDLIRSDLLPPILIHDVHREAQRRALVRQVPSHGGRLDPAMRVCIGSASVLAGCLVQDAEQRLTAVSPRAAPAPCGCGG